MATGDEFEVIGAVLSEFSPAHVEIRGIELRGGTDTRRVVTLHTLDPMPLIGPRGKTADALRRAMAERLGDADLQLNIVEARDDPPPDAPPPPGSGAIYPPE